MGVPGQIKGLHEAWLRYGRVPWADLIKPSIEMCRNGIVVNGMEERAIAAFEEDIRRSPSLKYDQFLLAKGSGGRGRAGGDWEKGDAIYKLENKHNLD